MLPPTTSDVEGNASKVITPMVDVPSPERPRCTSADGGQARPISVASSASDIGGFATPISKDVSPIVLSKMDIAIDAVVSQVRADGIPGRAGTPPVLTKSTDVPLTTELPDSLPLDLLDAINSIKRVRKVLKILWISLDLTMK